MPDETPRERQIRRHEADEAARESGFVDPIQSGDPRYDGFRVESCFAFLAIDPADNQEGCPAMHLPDGSVMPMVAFDERRAESLKPLARAFAQATGREVRLVRFDTKTEIETYRYDHD